MLSAPDFKNKKIIFVQLSRGEKMSFKNSNIIIKDEEGKIRHQSSCYRLFAVFLVGHITVTSGILQRARRYGFSLTFLTHNLRFYGKWNVGVEGNVLLRQKQYEYDSLEIAQQLIANKIAQQITILKSRRNKSDDIKQSIKSLTEYQSRLPNYSLGLQDVLGIEGIASKVYFKQVFDGMNWQGRKPRVKHDITNCLLDIGYTLLFNVIESLLNLYGFDVYKGVYHQTFYQRKSLVCDLVEPFRPIIDARVRKAYQLNQINESDFSLISGQYNIFGKKANPYVSILLTEILEHKMEMFLYVQTYYRAFMQQKPIENYPIFTGKRDS